MELKKAKTREEILLALKEAEMEEGRTDLVKNFLEEEKNAKKK